MLWGRSTFFFLLGSEDLVHHILIVVVVGRGGVHVLDLVGWEEERVQFSLEEGNVKEGVGVGVLGI